MNSLVEAQNELGSQAATRIIERLVGRENHARQILSVFLTVDPGTAVGRKVSAQLQDVLRPIIERLSPDSNAAHTLKEEARRAAGLIELMPPGARGVAAYMCAEAGLALVVPLPFSVPARAHWDRHAWLGPLRDLANPRNWLLLLVADKTTGRAFVAGFDTIHEIGHTRDYVPGHHDQGGQAQSNLSRRHDEWVRRHARNLARELDGWSRKFETGGLGVAAPPEMLAVLKHELPARHSGMPVSYLRVALAAPVSDIRTLAQQLIDQRRHNFDEALIETVLEAIGLQRAVVGLPDIAAAIAAGQVQLLVADERATPRGAVCQRCDLILPLDHAGDCPACAGRVAEQPVFLEYLADRVIRQGGRYEPVASELARPLAATGGMAALLRYPLAQHDLPDGE